MAHGNFPEISAGTITKPAWSPIYKGHYCMHLAVKLQQDDRLTTYDSIGFDWKTFRNNAPGCIIFNYNFAHRGINLKIDSLHFSDSPHVAYHYL